MIEAEDFARQQIRSRMQASIFGALTTFLVIAFVFVYVVIQAGKPGSPAIQANNVASSVEVTQISGLKDVATCSDTDRESSRQAPLTKRQEQQRELREIALVWLKESLQNFSRGVSDTRSTIEMKVGATSALFSVLDAVEDNEPERLSIAISSLRGIYDGISKEVVATFVNNLGAHYSLVTADGTRSEPMYFYETMALFNEAMRLRKGIYGIKPHPDVAETLLNMATVLQTRDPSRANRLGREGYEILLKTLGPNHQRTLDAKEDWIDFEE